MTLDESIRMRMDIERDPDYIRMRMEKGPVCHANRDHRSLGRLRRTVRRS
jgi:hypothetical protein